MKSVDIEGVTISVENTDRYTTDNRSIFEWSIDLDGTQYRQDDLKSGCGAEPSELEMLETLLSFLGAAAESYRYGGMEGENSHLFPEPVVKWAAENMDAISCEECNLDEELENEKRNYDEAEEVRDTAYAWHEGQNSALYAFASSGLIKDHDKLVTEINDCCGENENDCVQLGRLHRFVWEALKYDQDLRAWVAPWYGE